MVDGEPFSIFAGVPTVITVIGSTVGDDDMIVFLAAGTADCDGAAAARRTQGGRVRNSTLTVTMQTAASYKACHSTHIGPHLDSRFHYVSATEPGLRLNLLSGDEVSVFL